MIQNTQVGRDAKKMLQVQGFIGAAKFLPQEYVDKMSVQVLLL